MANVSPRPAPPPCRLCRGFTSTLFFKDKSREYFKCSACGAIFVPDAYLLSASAEKREYDLHDNFNEDEGYRKFLSRTAEPLQKYLPAETANLRGLDFGCGPNPLLAKMLAEPPLNCTVDCYDKFYFPENTDILRTAEPIYDFITSTEVFEHLHDPQTEAEALWRVLRPGGVLVIMTKRAAGTVDKFRNWHYIRDPTHILFFSEDSFHWLANHLMNHFGYPCSVVFEGPDVAVLMKSSSPR